MVRLSNDKVNITWGQLKDIFSEEVPYGMYRMLDMCEMFHDLNTSLEKSKREPYVKPQCQTMSLKQCD